MARVRRGEPVPPQLAEAVRAVTRVPAAARPFLAAFDALHARRHWAVGMGGAVPQPIAVTETFAYADEYTLPRRLALALVGACDEAWRAAYAAQQRETQDDDPKRRARRRTRR